MHKRSLGQAHYLQEHVWSIQSPLSTSSPAEHPEASASASAQVFTTNDASSASVPAVTPLTKDVGNVTAVLLESNGDTVAEEDAPLETCRKMAHSINNAYSPSLISPSAKGREFLEFHDGVSSTTILGELFGHKTCGRFVRLNLHDSQTTPGYSDTMSGDTRDFLHKRGAFSLPPPRSWYEI